MARSLDPRRLMDSQVESVMDFARSRPLIKQRGALIEAKHCADDVGELLHHLRILVKNWAKKLQALQEHHKVEEAGGGEVMGPPSKSSPPLIFHYASTNTLYQWLNRIGPPLTTHGH